MPVLHVDIAPTVRQIEPWMRSPGDKKAATFRLSVSTKDKLQNAARVLSRSESDVVETAVLEYLKNHSLDTYYLLKPHEDHLVLLKVEGGKPEVIDVFPRNGVPLNIVCDELAMKMNAPVKLELKVTVSTGDGGY